MLAEIIASLTDEQRQEVARRILRIERGRRAESQRAQEILDSLVSALEQPRNHRQAAELRRLILEK
jgi:hypothetical protein